MVTGILSSSPCLSKRGGSSLLQEGHPRENINFLASISPSQVLYRQILVAQLVEFFEPDSKKFPSVSELTDIYCALRLQLTSVIIDNTHMKMIR